MVARFVMSYTKDHPNVYLLKAARENTEENSIPGRACNMVHQWCICSVYVLYFCMPSLVVTQYRHYSSKRKLMLLTLCTNAVAYLTNSKYFKIQILTAVRLLKLERPFCSLYMEESRTKTLCICDISTSRGLYQNILAI